MRNPSNYNLLRIAITTGDPDGIGTEIAAKALKQIGPQPHVQFVLWRSPQCPKTHLTWIDEKFRRLEIKKDHDIWSQDFDPGVILDVVSSDSPTLWVWTAAQACQAKLCDALVTGPLSKWGQIQDGFKTRGHTELLSLVSKKKDLFMSFAGNDFGVVLATSHIPLKSVSSHLNFRRLHLAIDHALFLRKLLPKEKRTQPVGLVGLNPHAGEKGLIGKEETTVFSRVLHAFSQSHPNEVVGPLVPDAAFLPHTRSQLSVYVCSYHDQGLIPFKMVHGFDQGVHLTLGLPFVRTSVDHGTAKELFGKNSAKAGSMVDAIQAALLLTQPPRGDV